MLTKIINETYVLKKDFDSKSQTPLVKIKDELKHYTIPLQYGSILDIPSIPGGKIKITLRTRFEGPLISEVKINFYYLENADKRKIEYLRSIFHKQGFTLH